LNHDRDRLGAVAKTLSFERVGAIYLLVHDEVAPNDEDWRAHVAFLRQAMPELKAVLVFGDGAGPNASQRKLLQSIPGVNRCPTAVITISVVARGIVTAISWFGATIRAFAPAALAEAFAWLGLSEAERLAVLRRIAELKAQLAGVPSIDTRAADRVEELARLTAIAQTRVSKLRSLAADRAG
jgi:predicted Fe-S protein YdhL (DUF1289 family)